MTDRTSRVFIIAEAGVNHNGSLELAKKLIDAVVDAGADAVKFQTFITEKSAVRSAPKADYQKKTTDSTKTQYEMGKKYELSFDDFKELQKYCVTKGILFLSSAFDLESVEFLNEIGLEIFKIPSGEITNLPYLRKIGALNKKVILSTGMSNLQEIADALEVLTSAGTAKNNIIVLHCNSAYPSPMEDVNLRAMLTLKEDFGVEVGYSDHTLGIEIPIAAVALGAKVIEKHFTLDRTLPGPDHAASLEPDELKSMVQAIRNVEKAMGSGLKEPSASELKNRDAARKSIVAVRNIKKGEVFTEENITAKRPGTGISPMLWDTVIGQKASRDFSEDDEITI